MSEQPIEQHNTGQEHEVLHGFDAYDEVPRGPSVFAADSHALDNGDLYGTWIDLDPYAPDCEAQVISAGLTPSGLVIVDQIGLGPAMIDEALAIAELQQATERFLREGGDER
jgi:hypothetical protein